MAADLTPPPHAEAFLAASGWAGAHVTPLAGDASFRRYFRVRADERSAVLMDAPPPHEDVRPFLRVARWLEQQGVRAPAALAVDEGQGLVLLEDLGDKRLREVADASPGRELALYEQAVDLLVGLPARPAGPFPPYDLAVLRREAALLTQWYCPVVGLEVDASGYDEAWAEALAPVLRAEPVTVLRDYHAENIMLVGDPPTLALLDFQDALAGHPAYDLVSLLQDARRDVDPKLETAMLARYREATGEGDDFVDAYHLLGAQRNAKIVGIFTRLWRRDGKERYAALCPRVWAYLERDLAHPALGPVARWFDANVPAAKRGDPVVLATA